SMTRKSGFNAQIAAMLGKHSTLTVPPASSHVIIHPALQPSTPKRRMRSSLRASRRIGRLSIGTFFLQLLVMFADEVRVTTLLEFELYTPCLIEAAVDQLRGGTVEERDVNAAAKQTLVNDAVKSMCAKRLGQDLRRYVLGYRFVRRYWTRESMANLPPCDLLA